MRKRLLLSIVMLIVAFFSLSSRDNGTGTYNTFYSTQLDAFSRQQDALLTCIEATDISNVAGIEKIKQQLQLTRNRLKGMDFWFRYLEPTVYKKINGPLPVEWETEVFEKFERPYKRVGAGLTLAELYLDEESKVKDTLIQLIQASIDAKKTFLADSITVNLNTHHHFFLANRLFLLNLAAIYTTGFECPEPGNIIPELQYMLESVKEIYANYDQSFTTYPLREGYLNLYNSAISFVDKQSKDAETFDHFTFIKDY